MAYDATGMWKPEDDSVEKRLRGMLSTSSPYITRARTGAALTANRRGLVNSSIAAGAGEAAAIDAALPIASQDAAQTSSKNLSGQAFRQESGLSAQSSQQQQELLRANTVEQLKLDEPRRAHEERLAGMDQASRERIAQLDVDQRNRQSAQQAVTSTTALYSDLFKSVVNNPDIPAATRDQYLQHALAVQQANISLAEQMFGVDLDYADENFVVGAPEPAATPTTPTTTPATTPPPATAGTGPDGRSFNVPTGDYGN